MQIIDADGKKKEIDIFFESVPSGGGRPRKILTQDAQKLIENLGRIMCTEEEIAQCLNCSPETLMNGNNRELFKEALKKGQSQGKMSLRRNLYKLSETKPAVAIFLAKNYLGMTDRQTVDFNASDEKLDEMKTYLEFIKNGKEDI